MRKLKKGIKLLLVLMITCSCIVVGKSAFADIQGDFIQKLTPIVKSVSKKYNLYASIMMAQAALESNWGQSQLAVQANNYFGMKGSYNGQSVSMPTAEYDSNGRLYYTNANFKKYPNAYDSIDDNGNLLRNGTSWDPNYYSGTRKENTVTFEDAAKSLVGKYATSPQYASLLINLINQYNWNDLDQNVNNYFNHSKSSNTNQNKNKPKRKHKKHRRKPVYAKVKYNYIDSESWKLAPNYQNVKLYRNIPNTKKKINVSPWMNHNAFVGQKIYVDSIAYSRFKGKKSTWYRLRFRKSNHARKYWTDRSVIDFPKIIYFKLRTNLLINHQNNEPLYNHVMGNQSLAKHVSDTSYLRKNQYLSNYMAIVNDHNNSSIWYRIKISKHRNGWGNDNYLFNNKNVQYVPEKSKMNLNDHYGKYDLYEHVPGTHKKMKTSMWSDLNNAIKNNAVDTDQLAIINYDQSIWYRIIINHHKYWVSSQAFN